jgi:hypothetical protein
MSLTLVNNNYVGEMNKDIAALLSLGAKDSAFFHVMLTKGSKVRFPFLSVSTTPEAFTSICAVTDNSDRTREVVDLDLKSFVFQETACKDEEFRTDWANANGSYESQTPDPAQMEEWAMMHADAFTLFLQNLRWSGDIASLVPALAHQDGIVAQLLAKGAYDVALNPEGYQQVAATPVTAANAIQRIGAVVDAIPQLFVKLDPLFKIVISQTVANFLIQQCRNTTLTVGLASVPQINYNVETGQILDATYFGAPVFVAAGLDATATNSNIIMAGLFGDSRKGVLKYGVTDPMEGENVTMKEVQDGDAIRLRAIHSQAVTIIPNVSQVAMNL